MILIMHKCLEMMVVNRHGDDVVHEFGKDVDWSDRCRRRGIRFSKTTENCLPFSLVAVYSIVVDVRSTTKIVVIIYIIISSFNYIILVGTRTTFNCNTWHCYFGWYVWANDTIPFYSTPLHKVPQGKALCCLLEIGSFQN